MDYQQHIANALCSALPGVTDSDPDMDEALRRVRAGGAR